jgi:TonB-linked SusC/RagA family outer membrane protein
MKKKRMPGNFPDEGKLLKIFLIMRLSLLFICWGLIQVSANTYSQNTRLNIKLENASIKELLNDIKKQSEFTFVYNVEDVEKIGAITCNLSQSTVEEILDYCLSRTNMTYVVKDKVIVITPKEEKNSPQMNHNKPNGSEQPAGKQLKGKVTDAAGAPLPGVTITIVGTTRGVITDTDGSFTIEVKPSDKLVFSFIGFESQIFDVGNQEHINVKLKEKSLELEDVTVVAFAKQKKESVISSIETINNQDLRVPSSNLTTAFAGRMAGVISYQTSGEPGQDNAEFFIRGVTSFGAGKVDPLILIDNVEVTTHDLSRLHPDDIQSFSILKDATATALYGARGANGVILVTTKEGKEGKTKVSLRIENSFSSPTRKIELADPVTYMRLANEAALTRNPSAPIYYSNDQIDNTILGTNPYVYPSVDWMELLTKDVAVNQRANLNISGGGKVARYYIAGSFSQDNGILNVDKRNNFNNNIDLKKYLIRSNININLTSSTEAIVRVHGTFDEYYGPTSGGNELYKRMLKVSPVRFPAYYEPDETYQNTQHILFGGYDGDQYMNPYAEMVKGYRQESKTILMAQMELKQDFGQWIEGLTARLLGNTTRNSSFDLSRNYNPFYYQISNYDNITDTYRLIELNPETGTEYLSYNNGYKTVASSFYAEGSVAYEQTFGEKHGISGMLVGIARSSLTGNAKTLSESLPKRNLGLSGRFTYDYDSRYLAELNFGYNGSEKFDAGHRWGFFPSFGVGWIISNESFWKNGMDKLINKLKIKGTYGLVGNDEIGSQRFFYLSEVNIGAGGTYQTGYDFTGKNRTGVKISNYENSMIGWEIARKANVGIELGLFDGKIDIIADLFKEHRTNILQSRANIPSSMGLWATPQANVGQANGKGIDISLDYNQTFRNQIWIIGRANFTYARTTFDYYEEPDYSAIPWRSRIGLPISQRWGYVAERLFIDNADVANAPRQDFGEYRAGDIKYKDINNDGVINEIDLVAIGYPITPEVNYGFGLSAGYKNFDVSFFFQGSARSSFWIDAEAMAPFIQTTADGKIMETGLTKFIADDHWSEASQNPFAKWPRLSTYEISNNTQRSTWFMQDGSFLRLKSAEMGYSLPAGLLGKIKLKSCRLYASGTNLFLLSRFRLWDVEMGGNGLGYPIQRVINLGINVSF